MVRATADSGGSGGDTPKGGVSVMQTKNGQLVVIGIVPDCPADKAGLKVDDIITAMDGEGDMTATHVEDKFAEPGTHRVSVTREERESPTLRNLVLEVTVPEGGTSA